MPGSIGSSMTKVSFAGDDYPAVFPSIAGIPKTLETMYEDEVAAVVCDNSTSTSTGMTKVSFAGDDHHAVFHQSLAVQRCQEVSAVA